MRFWYSSPLFIKKNDRTQSVSYVTDFFCWIDKGIYMNR